MADDKKLVTATGEAPGFNYGFTAQIGAVTIQIMGVLPATADTPLINRTFDELSASLNRQIARTAIIGIEAELQKIERTINNLQEDIVKMDEKWKGRAKLPDNEAASKHNLEVTLRDLQAKQKDTAELLEKTRKEAE